MLPEYSFYEEFLRKKLDNHYKAKQLILIGDIKPDGSIEHLTEEEKEGISRLFILDKEEKKAIDDALRREKFRQSIHIPQGKLVLPKMYSEGLDESDYA